MKLCSVCHNAFPDDAAVCHTHGDKLKPDSLLGTHLGSFAVDAWLGEGGMGVLYRARHVAIQRSAAVKVLKREFITDETMAGRFGQEARAIARIGHPHLIDIFDIGTTPDGRLYYIMELLEGRALADVMEMGRMPFSIFGPLLIQACTALEAAHAVGIVHRDLKPDNLFLVERDNEPPFVKVLDFGVAKVLGTDEDVQSKLTRTGSIVGTPQYMAPEQIEGTKIDHRADVYALGVILYELATGSLPFRAETIGGMLKAHLLDSPPPFHLGQLADGVSPDLEAITLHAMAKRSDDRYPSVKALREDLERAMEGQVPEAVAWLAVQPAQTPLQIAMATAAGIPTTQIPITPSASTQQILARTRPDRRLVFGGIAVGGVAVAALAGLVLWPKPPPPEVPKPVVARPAIPKPKGPDVPALKSKALGVLTAALKDGDPSVRHHAVETIASGRDARHRTLIEPLLDDADTSVRSSVASGLATLGARGSIGALSAALGKDPEVDVAVAEALATLGDPDGKKQLKVILKKGSVEVRFKAALALSDAGDKDARHQLEKIAAKAELPVAVAIEARLARGGDGKARAKLGAIMEEGSGGTRLLAAEALARMGDESGRAELSRVGGDEKAKERLTALGMLSTLDDQSGYDLFRSTFADPAKSIPERLISARGLGASGEKAALTTLAPGLDESEPAIRIAAAGAVLAIAGVDPRALAARSTDWATSALSDGSWTVRESAAAVLGDLEAGVAVPLLGKAIHDEQPEVRRAAARALGRTNAVAAVPILDEALADQKGDVRVVALRSMGQVGKATHDASARERITKHLEKATPEEKVVAAASLVKLGDRSHIDELKGGLASSDPEIRKLAVEESAADPETSKDANASALKDKSFPVRFAAATQLADQGSKEGVPVLQEAVKRGGADGLAAYGALKKLGVEPAAEIDSLALLDSRDAGLRLAAVESASHLDKDREAVFLKRALADPDPRVRGAAVDAAAAMGPSGLPLVKAASNDADPAVRAKAGALVARLSPKDKDEAPPAPVVEKAKPAAPPPSDLGPPPATHDSALPTVAAVDAAAAAPVPEVAEKIDTHSAAKDESTSDEARIAMSTGDVYLTAGKFDAALREFGKAHKLDGKLPVFFGMGEAYRRLGDRQTDHAKQRDLYGKAIANYKRAREAKAKSYAAELQERMKESP